MPTHLSGCVGLMNPAGRLSEYRVPLPRGAMLRYIAADALGGAWLLPDTAGRVGRLTPAGTTRWFTYSPGYANQTLALTADGTGGAWFSLNDASVAHISAAGVVSIHPTGTVTVLELAAAAGGGVWGTGTQRSGNRYQPVLVHISPEGSVSTAARMPLGSGLTMGQLVATPGGSVWFIEQTELGRAVAVTRLTGTATLRFPLRLPGPDSRVGGLAVTPDGNLWFTVLGLEFGEAGIGRVGPDGAVTVFRRGLSRFSDPLGITVSSTGQLWFTEQGAARIGRISPDGAVTETPPSPAVLGFTHTRSRLTVRLRCPTTAPAACTGSVQLRLTALGGRAGAVVGQRRFRVPRGATMRVEVGLNARALRILRSTGSVDPEVLIRASSPATGQLGNQDERRVVIRAR